ncbi:MAG: ComEC/Rec2 family competence protein [Candidatus Daviesbacteria bacterium]|nr:ComEC/Rec2 family competence protein [Candidatus Daviesbacteria bacterium]
MFRILGLGILLWFIVFTFRVISIGGIDPTYRDPSVNLLQGVRDNLTQIIDQSLPSPQNALLSGILLGTQSDLPIFLKNDLKITSTIHMVVVSGQNLSMLAGFVANLVGFLGRKKTLFLTLFVIIFYSLLTGLGVPVLRAAIMVIFAYLAQILGKDRSGWWILFLTAGLMLIYNPNWLLNISFQLSFLATFGVVVVAPILMETFKKVPEILKQDLATTISAQALVLPIIAFNFNQISLAGIFANILVLWTIPLVMVSGIITLISGIINPVLGQISGLVPSIMLTYFIDIVSFFAKIPGASLNIAKTSVIIWIGYYLIIGALIWILYKRDSHK